MSTIFVACMMHGLTYDNMGSRRLSKEGEL
jgi:hypothetical protein